MLRRILGYARQRLGLDGLLQQNIHDSRKEPRIPAVLVARSALVMMLTRLGSFNALEQSRPSGFWLGNLGRAPPSADTMGRVCQAMDLDGLRAIQHAMYERLKRGKALEPPPHGLILAVLDAHESHATFRRCCCGCLERTIRTKQGERIQYYHRDVTMSLVTQDLHLLIDAEPIRKGEDEVAAATRLFDRVVAAYPRAFDVVGGDGLYAQGPFFNHVRAAGKHVMAVLKNEQRDLMADAAALWAQMPPTAVFEGQRHRECWDLADFTTWPQCQSPVRVVRSHETWSVRRQLTGEMEQRVSDWIWVTTLPSELASTHAMVQLGHGRWDIENQAFNELVNRWHADHVYRHAETAMLVMWLFAMMAANLFAAFYRRNLKPAVRATFDTLHIARQMLAELMEGMPPQPRAP
jgi:hypothetical protein